MNYWILTVMYDWYPDLWPALVKQGLAAQHYPPGWTNEVRNLKALRQMQKGDGVLAAMMAHRFSAYGFLKTDFYRGGNPLHVDRDDRDLAFQERAEIDWIAVPLSESKPYVDCRHLKAKGYDIDLRRGLCLRETDKRTFEKIQEILEKAGAKRQMRRGVMA